MLMLLKQCPFEYFYIPTRIYTQNDIATNILYIQIMDSIFCYIQFCIAWCNIFMFTIHDASPTNCSLTNTHAHLSTFLVTTGGTYLNTDCIS